MEKIQIWHSKSSDPHEKGMLALYLASQGCFQPSCDSQTPYQLAATALSSSKSTSHLSLMLQSKNQEIVIAALKAFGLQGSPNAIASIIPFLTNHSAKISREAAHTLLRIVKQLSKSKNSPNINSWYFYGEKICQALSETTDPVAQNFLIETIELTSNSITIIPLLKTITRIPFRLNKKIESIILKIGRSAAPNLIWFIQQKQESTESRFLASYALYQIAPALLNKNFKKLIEDEIKIATFYLVNAHFLTQSYPHYQLNHVKDLLIDNYYSSVAFIIKLYALISATHQDIKKIIKSARSSCFTTHKKAKENLRYFCPQEVINLLFCESDIQFRLSFFNLSSPKQPPCTLQELISFLEKRHTSIDNILAIQLRKRFSIGNWKKSLYHRIKNQHSFIRHINKEIFKN